VKYRKVPEPWRQLAVDADMKLHVLWTWAVGKLGYDKRAWQALSGAISKLIAGYERE